MEKENKKQRQLKIELDENSSQGEYVNFAVVSHSPAEFILDFIRMLPGMPKAKVKSRVILTPEHAKRFKIALNDNIQRYEKSNGIIETNEPPKIPLNFGLAGKA